MNNSFPTLVKKVLDAGLSGANWDDVCEAIATYTNSTAVMVYEFDFHNPDTSAYHCSHLFRQRGVEAIASLYAGDDASEMKLHSAISNSKPMVLHTEDELLGSPSSEELTKNQFRRHVLSLTGAKSRNGGKINDVGPFVDVAAMHLPISSNRISLEARAEFGVIMTLLGKSIETGRTIRTLTGRYQTLLSAFDQLDFGVAFLTSNGRVSLANNHFREIAGERDGLLMSGGLVTATNDLDAENLRQIVTKAFFPGVEPSQLITSLRRRSLATPLVAKVCPIQENDISKETTALLFVVDPSNERRVSVQGLSAFGLLSPAELEVCELLLKGVATDGIAERRSTSIFTTQDQIKSANAKLGCSSRLDILRLAMASNPPTKG